MVDCLVGEMEIEMVASMDFEKVEEMVDELDCLMAVL